MTRWARILIIVGALLAPASEADAGQFTSPFSSGDAQADSKRQETSDRFAPMSETGARPAAPPADAFASQTTNAYRIGPQDVLDISVFGVSDLSGTVVVAANGSIQLPLLGETPAAGKTPRELQADLASRLGAEYLQNPQVTVLVKEYNSRTVILTGEIKSPGVYPLKGETSLLQLVAQAGGFGEASDSTVLVLRKSGGKRTAARFDVSDIEKGRMADPILQGGDTVLAGSSAIKRVYKTFLKALPVAGAFAILPSDARLKRHVRHLTTLDNGLRIYSFEYLWDNTAYVGVMAQDLLDHEVWGTAVVEMPNGYYAVDYAALGLRMTTLAEWQARGMAVLTSRPAEGSLWQPVRHLHGRPVTELNHERRAKGK